MPELRALEQCGPYLPAFAEADLRACDCSLRTLAGERDAHLLLAVFENADGDAVALSRQVDEEVFARQFRACRGNLGRVDQDVIRKEIRQD